MVDKKKIIDALELVIRELGTAQEGADNIQYTKLEDAVERLSDITNELEELLEDE
jgi:hypothetical protein